MREVTSQVVSAHQIKTASIPGRKGARYHHAGCTCDPAIEFAWYERDQEHREHLHEAIFNAGYAAGKASAEGGAS